MFWMACASSGATDTTRNLGQRSNFPSSGMVSVTRTSSTELSLISSQAWSLKTPWTTAPITAEAPFACSFAAALTRLSAVSAMSQTTMQSLPCTSPTKSISPGSVGRLRCLENMASDPQSLAAKAEARLAPLTSGLTTTKSSARVPRAEMISANSRASNGSAYMLSMGYEAKPWIWAECNSIVSTRSAPAAWSRSVTNFAQIGDRPRSFALCLE
mmetsp:Transcript_63873/g.152333  ORF Transcript_63873/g.152333 Transcript_63873/m.152333 type:complete len:214 (-) Transcript_63873:653-1294(-)